MMSIDLIAFFSIGLYAIEYRAAICYWRGHKAITVFNKENDIYMVERITYLAFEVNVIKAHFFSYI
jgi:hypothetical protein